MATQTTSASLRQPGMEKGFALSPMGDLVRQYNAQDVDLSTFIRSMRIATAGLVKDRSSTYEIDPHGVLSALLKGSESLGGILAAWIALSERVHLAQKNFDKYQSEYGADKEEDILRSPVSTDPDIYKAFPRTQDAGTDLDYLYDHVPHLRRHWPPGYRTHSDSIALATPVSEVLQEAFPPRSPEDRPATVYYSAEGERREISVSPRSSRGAGPDFQLPPTSEDEKSRRTKRREASKSPRRGRARSLSAEPLRTEKRVSRRDRARIRKASASGGESGWEQPSETIASGAGLMSSGMQFKAPGDPLVPTSPRDHTYATSVPGKSLPNPLSGYRRNPGRQ
ncbi:hypothetical protein B0H14DRAFT_2644579 [Mycena olivaceomarginata]|nr:hypothetical protein B0H14DRAFT_2644579 [Mycena olivaceomarginata]